MQVMTTSSSNPGDHLSHVYERLAQFTQYGERRNQNFHYIADFQK